MVAPNGMMPVYPFYHYQYHGSQGLGVPAAHFFPPASAAAAVPAIISKPTVMAPPPKGNKHHTTPKSNQRTVPSWHVRGAMTLSCRAKLAGTRSATNLEIDLVQSS
jgi:hypothetical protein